eukprot:m.274320 g.274320  ORF g.274320 m.274320 type:complete len:76 (-) comp17685_c0_seq5:4171-4398(-)
MADGVDGTADKRYQACSTHSRPCINSTFKTAVCVCNHRHCPSSVVKRYKSMLYSSTRSAGVFATTATRCQARTLG